MGSVAWHLDHLPAGPRVTEGPPQPDLETSQVDGSFALPS